MSILLLYLRTFAIDRKFRWTVWIVLSITVASHFVCWMIIWTEVTPLNCQWTLYPTNELVKAHCAQHFDSKHSGEFVVFVAALNVVLDIIVLAIPCPHVWRLQLPKKQKIMIILVLLTGAL